MSEPYEEIVEGEIMIRFAPDPRHEEICRRLHALIGATLASLTSSKLLPPRTVVQLSPGTMLRPDVALVTLATNKLWLAAEVVAPHDHRIDTVTKKDVYEEKSVPRLWMIDPRYDNVEVYHGSPYGLVLKKILGGTEMLTENLLPSFTLRVSDLFIE